MQIDFMGNPVLAWQLFASVGILFMALEMVVPGFIMLPIGIAFIMTSVSTVFVASATGQLGVLGVSLIVVFLAIQRWAKNRPQSKVRTNVNSMVGQVVEVTDAIKPPHMGYVKLYGDRWQAKSFFEEESYEVGAQVVITSVDGNKVIVERKGE